MLMPKMALLEFFRILLAEIRVEYIPSISHWSWKIEVGLYDRTRYTPYLFFFFQSYNYPTFRHLLGLENSSHFIVNVYYNSYVYITTETKLIQQLLLGESAYFFRFTAYDIMLHYMKRPKYLLSFQGQC